MNQPETNRDRLIRFSNAVMSGDRKTYESLLHPLFEVREADSLPYAGTYRGISGWNELWQKVNSTWTDLNITPEKPIGTPDGDVFGWFMHMKGRSIKTGRTFEVTVFEQWSFKDSLIINVLPHYWDTKAVAAADTP